MNPILPGFNPDACICRKNNDYYIAVSSFEWLPGLPIYHSKDLKNWELYTHILTDDKKINLKGLPSAKGLWAPCLTYCEEENLFYVIYGIMHSMNARYFDIDNYLITAKDIRECGVNQFIFTQRDLTHLYTMEKMEENGLYLWSGKRERDMRSQEKFV